MINKEVVKKGKVIASDLIYTDRTLDEFNKQIKFYRKKVSLFQRI